MTVIRRVNVLTQTIHVGIFNKVKSNFIATCFHTCKSNHKMNHSDPIVEQRRKARLSLRQWKPQISGKCLPSEKFKLMSYNVLSQALLYENPQLYTLHLQPALVWEVRRQMLWEEITSHNPDILCLQEVEQEHIREFYDKFHEIGYKSIFKQRTQNRPDGCAIFYKYEMFNLIEHSSVEFDQNNGNLTKPNVAIIARFQRVNSTKHFILTNTHLLYNPRRSDIRLAQMQVLMAEIDRLAFLKIDETNRPVYLPIILCGDFNSEPMESVYNYITCARLRYRNARKNSLTNTGETGSLPYPFISPDFGIDDNSEHVILAQLRAKNFLLCRKEEYHHIKIRYDRKPKFPANYMKNVKQGAFNTGEIRHKFHLDSVYDKTDKLGSTFQDRWITVDFIFYGSKVLGGKCEGKLTLLSRYELPKKSECDAIGYVPNFLFGSDHLALLAEFSLQ